jgi:acyl-CoA synthetase (AMP-forming)/AMP-acid ligase II
MYLKSQYPDVPPQPNVNAHHFFFHRPDQADWPNFTVHIDVETGEEIMYDDFLERIRDLATGLGASVSQGGLGIRAENKEMIGILGENSSVSCTFSFFVQLVCLFGLQEYITLVHACIRLATPFAPISSFSTPFELKHALNLTQVTRLFVDEKFLTTVVPVATELGIDLDHIYMMKGDSNSRKSFWSIIRDVRSKKIPREDARTVTKNTLAYLVFSSGTSGLPKGN